MSVWLLLFFRVRAAAKQRPGQAPVSPDLNPIEQAFAKIKHSMRLTQKRTIDDARAYTGALAATISPASRNGGYGSVTR